MDLYLLRHAIAEQRDPEKYSDDSKRPLSAEGRKKMKKIARGMKNLGVSFDLALSSPYTRAKQTAQIAVREYKQEGKLSFSDNLAADGDPGALMNELRKNHAGLSSILLIGHEPYMSILISVLVSGDDNAAINFKKGGLCKLRLDNPDHGGVWLEWLLTPAQLRLLA